MHAVVRTLRAVARGLPAVVGLLVVSAVLTAPAGAPALDSTDQDPTGVIVVFRDGVDASRRHAILGRAGVESRRHFLRVPASAARVAASGLTALARHPDVVAVIPDRPVSVLGAKTDGVSATALQTVPAGVKRIGATPGALVATGLGIGVAVVDTGLDFGHRDLQPIAAPCFTAFATCQDDHGHGTHVGGTIAARDNAVDVVGVAPNARLYAVKVLDENGSGTDSTVIAGLEWVAEHASTVTPRIRVVNMSLGREGTLDDNPALRRAVQDLHDLGIAVVVAAGNDPALEVSEQVPAAYPEVIAVASTTARAGTNARCRSHPSAVPRDTASYFTSGGAWVPDPGGAGGVGVTISAPGEQQENISRRCLIASSGILSTRLGGGTMRMAGTSMATPHVTGVVALLAQQEGLTLTPEEARRRIQQAGARPSQAPLDSPAVGYSFDGQREGILSAPGSLGG